MSITERRALVTARIVESTGIDEAMIRALVHRFYAKVRTDVLLAPIFDRWVIDWDAHLARMCAFWSSVALLSGRYHGRPIEKHLPLPVDALHFNRWLSLFEEAASEICPPEATIHFMKRATRIAERLELGIAGNSRVSVVKDVSRPAWFDKEGRGPRRLKEQTDE